MEETTHQRFSMRTADPGVSDKEYSMWFAGHWASSHKSRFFFEDINVYDSKREG